jgi:hypothetical protein
MSLAVLLPITSRGCGRKILDNLEQLSTTTLSPQKDLLQVFLGIDKGDEILDKPDKPAEKILQKYGIEVQSILFKPSNPAPICQFWRELACVAYDKPQCDYFILLGDDVTIHNPRWVEAIIDGFKSLHQTKFSSLPFGFGCIALNDTSAVGFPTFPIVHRLHLDIFGKEHIIPSDFITKMAIHTSFNCINNGEDRHFCRELLFRIQLEDYNYWKNSTLHRDTKEFILIGSLIYYKSIL